MSREVTAMLGACGGLRVLAVAAVLCPAWAVTPRPCPARQAGGHAGEFLTRTHTDAAGRQWRYVVFVPESRTPGGRLPVVLFLNGVGQNGDDGLRQISMNFGTHVWRVREGFPFLAVCPQCPAGGSWAAGGADADRALAILDEAVAEFGGDPDRVCLTGVSAGGYGVWALGSAHPGRFAALVPVSSGGFGLDEVAAAAGPPVWAHYNSGDGGSLVASARAAHAGLIARGRSPLATEYAADGHDSWSAAYSDPALWAWMLRQSRAKNARSARFHPWPPETLLADWERRSGGWEAAGGELVGAADDGEDGLLLGPPAAGDAELHLEAFLGESGRTRLVLASGAGRLDLIIELPEAGGGGLRDPGGTCLAPLDPVGQRGLRPGWNDVRAARSGGRLTVELGGRPALDVEIPALGRGPVRFGLAAAAAEGPGRWRYLRTWSDAPGDAVSAVSSVAGRRPASAAPPSAAEAPRPAATAAPVTVEEVLAAWRSRAACSPVADLSWRTARNDGLESHNPEPSAEHQTWRLRLSGDRLRVDGVERLTAAYGGRLLSRTDDDARADHEFRQLLGSGFDRPPSAEVVRPRSWAFAADGGELPGAAALDRLAASAAVLAACPPAAANPVTLAVSPHRVACQGRECVVLDVAAPGGGRTLWADPAEGFRVVRAFGRDERFGPSQFDYEYDPGEPLVPARWTVQRLAAGGSSVASAAAERVALSRPASFPAKTFAVSGPASFGRSDPPPAPAASGIGRAVRAGLDSSWSPVLAAAAVLLFAVFKRRGGRRRGTGGSRS
jgi:hypothetical protein